MLDLLSGEFKLENLSISVNPGLLQLYNEGAFGLLDVLLLNFLHLLGHFLLLFTR